MPANNSYCWSQMMHWVLPAWDFLISIQDIDGVGSLSGGNIVDCVSLVSIIHHLDRLHDSCKKQRWAHRFYILWNVNGIFPQIKSFATTNRGSHRGTSQQSRTLVTFGSLNADLQRGHSSFGGVHCELLRDVGSDVAAEARTLTLHLSAVHGVADWNGEGASCSDKKKNKKNPEKVTKFIF